MIYFFIKNEKLAKSLKKSLKELGLQHEFAKTEEGASCVSPLYKNETSTSAIIADASVPFLPDNLWLDALANLSKRIPVLLLTDGMSEVVEPHIAKGSSFFSMIDPSSHDILTFLDTCSVLGKNNDSLKETIPLYSLELTSHILRTQGFISILSVQANDLHKLISEYGKDVHQQLQLCLHKTLLSLWGAKGSFRSTDVLCRKSLHGDTFYIFLERPRSAAGSNGNIALPGDLEKLADRVTMKLENLFWAEIFDNSPSRILPKFLDFTPQFSVGYATALNNPCVDGVDLIENLFEECRDSSAAQNRRMALRKKEFMQTMIQAPGILDAHFQGVFELKKIDWNNLDKVTKENPLNYFKHSLYAFESLVRVNKDILRRHMKDSTTWIDIHFLNPKVLFALAEEVSLTLELDQACFRSAMLGFKSIPYHLMVNILPRNFYYIHQLKHLIPENATLIFEVSETEAINNLALLQKARESLSKYNFGVAIDDFGRGYAGVDRIIQIQPNIIKIDQSLIENIHLEDQKRAFVKGIVDAGKSTGAVVLAEGVERAQELIAIRDLGVDLAQGYFLHRPESQASVMLEMKGIADTNTVRYSKTG